MYQLHNPSKMGAFVAISVISLATLMSSAEAQSATTVMEPSSNVTAEAGQSSMVDASAADEATAAVNAVDVKGHFAGKTPGAEALSGTGFTYRHDWGNRNGQWKLNLNWGAIRRDSRVFVAIGECDPAGGKFIGSARYTLHNVAPNNNRVSIWVNVEWRYPIRLCVDYLVINP
jgi:hypothetical protein